MPRKRIKRTKKTTYVLTGDFAQGPRTVPGGLRPDVGGDRPPSRHRVVNLWRWRRGVQPNMHHLLALQDLADSMGLGHLLPRVRPRRQPQSGAAP